MERGIGGLKCRRHVTASSRKRGHPMIATVDLDQASRLKRVTRGFGSAFPLKGAGKPVGYSEKARHGALYVNRITIASSESN